MQNQFIKKDVHGVFYYKDPEMTIYHREDGPADEYVSGSKFWWVNGERHRTDGPACEWADGSKEWWVKGVNFSEKQFNVFYGKS